MNGTNDELNSESAEDEALICAAIKGAFSAEYYLAKYHDIIDIDPLLHFVRVGWKEGRDPSENFSTNYYVAANKDVADTGVNPLYHFVTCGLHEGRRPLPLPHVYQASEEKYQRVKSIINSEFDSEFYMRSYPHSLSEMSDPLDHFLIIGWRSNLDPTSWFSVSNYLSEYDDVSTSGINPFYHYLVYGRLEGRQPKINDEKPYLDGLNEEKKLLASEFYTEFYLRRNPDVREAGIEPIEHYILFGWKEGRDPTPDFSTIYYLQTNPDVQAKGINPFYHYLKTGRAEGRQPVPPGGYVALALRELKSLEQRIAESLLQDNSPMEECAAAYLQSRLSDYLASTRPRVVIALGHDDYRSSVGGVQNCMLLEQNAVQAAGAIYLNLNPVVPLPVLSAETDWDRLLLNVICNGELIGVASARVCLDTLEAMQKRAGQIDLVVHALLGHSPEFVGELGKSLVTGRSIYWLHDYQSLCPGYNLLRNNVQYCGAPQVNSMACSVCIYGEERSRQSSRMQALFEALDFTVVAPSEFSAELWQRHCKLHRRELIIQPHTTFIETDVANSSTSVPEDRQGDSYLRVAYLGYPMFHKGWPLFRKLLHTNRKNPALEFHVLSVHPPDDIVGIRHTKVCAGSANPAAMTEALTSQRIDLAFIWSVWPETYCLIAHEAVAAGVPVLTNDQSGNVARMVSEHDAGLIFNQENEVLEAFTTGEINPMINALRTRRALRPMSLKYSCMAAEILGLAERI